MVVGRQRVLIHSHVWHPDWEDWNGWESSDVFLCFPLVSPHGLSGLVALEYLDVLHDSLELSRCISQERASHAQVASYLWASLWCHTASLLTAHLVQVVVTIPLQKKKIQEERAHTTPLDKKVVLIQEAHGEWNKYLAIFRKQNLPFLENTTFHGQV